MCSSLGKTILKERRGLPTEEELAFFEEKREGLDMLYHGMYVLIKDRALIAVYDRQDDVFREVGLRFSGQPCLVRFIGDEEDKRRTAWPSQGG